MNEQARKEWIVMRCIDAYHDSAGHPGQHKEPVPGLDAPMTREEALIALREIEALRPGEDFSIRRIARVLPLKTH